MAVQVAEVRHRCNVPGTHAPDSRWCFRWSFGGITNDNLGRTDLIALTGDYAKGIDAGIIDIIIVGNVDKIKLDEYITSVEHKIGRKVRYLLLKEDEFKKLKAKLEKDGMLILWEIE